MLLVEGSALTLTPLDFDAHARMSMPRDRVEFHVSSQDWSVQVHVLYRVSIRISLQNLQCHNKNIYYHNSLQYTKYINLKNNHLVDTLPKTSNTRISWWGWVDELSQKHLLCEFNEILVQKQT